MRLLATSLAILAGLLWAGVAAAADAAQRLQGIPAVIDGDTLDLAGTRVRLQDIDAPELGQQCLLKGKLYPCGEIARAALLDLTAGTEIVCELTDRNGTETARCTADDYDLSGGMVYTGWALADRRVSARYVTLENGAKAAPRGLWRGSFVAPWDWRDGQRLAEEAE